MSFLKSLSNSSSNSSNVSVYNSLRIQTSVYGICIPAIWGTTRITGNLFWYGDYNYVPASSPGGKGGGKGSGSDAYYTCSFCMALCEGIIAGCLTVWAGNLIYQNATDNFQTNDEAHTIPTSSPYTVTADGNPWVVDLGVQYEYNTYYGSYAPMTKVSGSPAANQYSVAGGVYTFNAANKGTPIRISYQWSALVSAITQAGLGLFLGAYSGNGWSYLAARGQEQPYPGVAYVVGENINIGPSGSLPNLSYEVQGRGIFPGLSDAHPATIVSDIMCDTRIGLVIPTGLINTATGQSGTAADSYYNYCLAANFMLSPAVTAQKAASDVMKEVLDSSNSDIILHNGKQIQFVPYGDTALTGNGVTFTPTLSPIYELGDDDFIYAEGEDPVKCTRKNTTDQKNHLDVEFLDRSNAYNINMASWDDQGNQDLYTMKRDTPKQLHMICQAGIAQNVAIVTGQRGLYIRNTYAFTLGWKYIFLEPMDLVGITDANLGLSNFPVRITKITENDDGKLDVEAEEFPQGVGYAPLYATQAISPFSINYNVDPGPVNTPLIFRAPGILTDSGYEIWAAVAGGPNWGGCHIYASTDGTTYSLIGKMSGPSRYGVVWANLPIGPDPDTTDTLSVNLATSGGQLVSGTQADADSGNTLCIITQGSLGAPELISYETATLTGTDQYNLTYVRRGFYHSIISAHAQYSPFARLDDQLFKYAFDPSLAGKTIYLKFTSFNQFGGAEESLASVTPYPFTIGPPCDYPSNVASLTATQNGSMVVFSWPPVTDSNEPNYEIRYNPQGNYTWADATPITQAEAGSHLVTAKVAPGAWSFMICAVDNAGNYSLVPATCSLTVLNTNDVIAGGSQAALDWPGTLTNVGRHWTGVLTPLSQGTASSDGWNTFNVFCPHPCTSCGYVAPEFVLVANAPVRVYGSIISALGPGCSGLADPILEVQYHQTSGSYSGFIPWTIGEINASNVEMEFTEQDAYVGQVYYQDFLPTLDEEQWVQASPTTGVSIPSTGLAVTFPLPYLQPPVITVTPIGTTSVLAVITGPGGSGLPTRLGFMVTLYNPATGAAVAGTATWSATGV